LSALADERNRNLRGRIAGEAYSVQHFLKDPDFQTLANEVVLARGDLAGEEGFGMDQQPGQVGIDLARVHWLWELWGASTGILYSCCKTPLSPRGGIRRV